jgi:hypothetical protein
MEKMKLLTVIGRGHKMHASACEFYTRLESQLLISGIEKRTSFPYKLNNRFELVR